MLAFVLRRLIQAVVVMLTVAFIAFMLFQYVGDPVTNLLGQDATAEQREQLRADLGLDAPFPVQFMRFVGNALRGEFGLSLRQGRRVSALIVERFPATIELAMSAAVIALLLGVPLGVYTALRRGSFGSQDSGSQGDADNALFKHLTEFLFFPASLRTNQQPHIAVVVQ